MKRLFYMMVVALVLFLSSPFGVAAGQHYYVAPWGNGNGSSWQTAHADLVAVLSMARAGVIRSGWRAAPIYQPPTEIGAPVL